MLNKKVGRRRNHHLLLPFSFHNLLGVDSFVITIKLPFTEEHSCVFIYGHKYTKKVHRRGGLTPEDLLGSSPICFRVQVSI